MAFISVSRLGDFIVRGTVQRDKSRSFVKARKGPHKSGSDMPHRPNDSTLAALCGVRAVIYCIGRVRANYSGDTVAHICKRREILDALLLAHRSCFRAQMRGPWPLIVRIAPDSDPRRLAKEPSFLTNGDQSFHGTFETDNRCADEKVESFLWIWGKDLR